MMLPKDTPNWPTFLAAKAATKAAINTFGANSDEARDAAKTQRAEFKKSVVTEAEMALQC